MIKTFLRKILSDSAILWTHKVRAVLANILYGYPSKSMKVIGVTGTNGKTTTCHLIASILEAAGCKVGMTTTINFKIGSKNTINETKMTTLSPFILQRQLSQMAKAKCEYAIIETTSHAIKQFRNWGIKYHSVVLTNITHDHLDYHKTFKDYLETKLKLFIHYPSVEVINRDDESFEKFDKAKAEKKYSYGIDNKADVAARKILYQSNGVLFTVVADSGQIPIDLPLPGKFNVYNALAAICVGLGEKISLETMKKGLENMTTIPGRMENLDYGQDYRIIIDFAHTPDGLLKVFEAVRPAVKGNIIYVGGATGNRDTTKRPILGAISGKWADICIVTNEDPYSENPEDIMEQVAAGVSRGAPKDNQKILGENFFKISNRKTAILKALDLARKGDLVLITGKGAETKMAVGENQFIPWSDREIVEENFKTR